jgi:hypothetical protein
MLLFINRSMRLVDLLESRPSQPPIQSTTDDLTLAVKEVAFLQARLKQLPNPDAVAQIDQQLQALGRSYQAEIWERKKAEVRAS